MTDISSRFIQLDNWIFEIKAVRAIKVANYGEPYSAISNFSLNGDIAYIDSLITKDNESFTRKDYQVFHQLLQKLDIKEVQYNRYKSNKPQQNSFIIAPQNNQIKQEKVA